MMIPESRTPYTPPHLIPERDRRMKSARRHARKSRPISELEALSRALNILANRNRERSARCEAWLNRGTREGTYPPAIVTSVSTTRPVCGEVVELTLRAPGAEIVVKHPVLRGEGDGSGSKVYRLTNYRSRDNKLQIGRLAGVILRRLKDGLEEAGGRK